MSKVTNLDLPEELKNETGYIYHWARNDEERVKECELNGWEKVIIDNEFYTYRDGILMKKKKDEMHYKRELINLYIDLYQKDKMQRDLARGILGFYPIIDPILEKLRLYNKLIELLQQSDDELFYAELSRYSNVACIKYDILIERKKLIEEQKRIARNIFENYLNEPIPECLKEKKEKDDE